jgi:2-polyprenyl-3-methyl-5-hydroxy-6-metoxy-1,4-benzoquinol methylase
MIRKISSADYSQEYFLSSINDLHSLTVYKKFLQHRGLPEIFKKAINHIPEMVKSGPFLDIGCGRGELVISLARSGFKADGIDYSDAAIKIANSTLKKEKSAVSKLANFIQSDCTKLPVKPGFYKCIFMMDIVEHLTLHDFDVALKEAYRIMAPGGVLIIHTNNKYYEKFIKYLVIFTYSGWKMLFHPSKTIAKYSNPYEYMHINYLTGGTLIKKLAEVGYAAKIEYVKPTSRKELLRHLDYNSKTVENFFVFFGWWLLNTDLIRFISPTYWIVAKKKNK